MPDNKTHALYPSFDHWPTQLQAASCVTLDKSPPSLIVSFLCTTTVSLKSVLSTCYARSCARYQL